jgi:hypothetical protein
MRPRLALFGACSIALAAAAWLWADGGAQPDGEVTPPDPDLEALLRHTARDDRKHKSAFFAALLSLGRKHEAKAKEYVPAWTDRGFAVRARGGQVVAVLREAFVCIPGSDTQYLLLLGHDGRQLDRLSCEVNSRLTHMHSGVFRTEVPWPAEKDGAEFILRYVPEQGDRIAGNWAHEIRHGGRMYKFSWDQAEPSAVPSTRWEKEGLCRVAVREGKFVVLFPRLGRPANDR